MFVAFLGVARAWNDTIAFADVMAIAAVSYAVAQGAVFAILAVAASGADPVANPRAAFVRRWLASLGNLGRPLAGAVDDGALRLELAGAPVGRRPQPLRGRRPVTG
jgi:hypothetical protein